MNKGLFALALGTFALGITEFLMMGILSNIATSMDVTITRAGHFISAYAAGVCIGAPELLFARKLPLKKLMTILAALITIGNLLTALAPSYLTFIAARFLSGLPHGAYFGVGAIVARKLVTPGKEASAVSLMIAGMTVATLAGVPAGTFITNNFHWRTAFFIVAFSGLCTLLAIHFLVRDVGKLPDMGFKGQFRFLRTLPPWLIFGGVILGQIGIYSWYSYIDPALLHVCGFSPLTMPWLMAIAGFGMFAGNLIAGRLSDRFKPSAVAAWVLGAAVPILILFYFFATVKIAAVLLLMLGTASLFGSGSPLQSSIVGYSKGGEMLGAACIQVAYNAGNAIAAYLGGIVINAGYSYVAPALTGVPAVIAGVVFLVILYQRNERSGARHRPYGC